MWARMKVCHVTPYSPREVSGVGQVVANLSKALRERKHSSMILTKSSMGSHHNIYGLSEIEYKKIRFVGGLLLSLQAMIRIFRARKNIDILHLHSVSWLTTSCALIGLVLGIPRVLTLHGRFPSLPNRFLNALFGLEEKLVIRLASKTTCVSRDTREFYELDRAEVVWNGIDTSRFRPDPEERAKWRESFGLEESFVLLFLGRWVAHKGIYDLIGITRNLIPKKAGLKLILVGSGEKERVLSTVRKSSLEEEVLPIGRVEDVVPFYRCSDLYILFSSPLEGIPLTLLEAMACGLPCIATSVSGIREVIRDGENGFLVEQGDKEALEKRVLRCIEDRKRLENISKEARKTVKKRFTMARMAEDYLRVYATLLKN